MCGICGEVDLAGAPDAEGVRRASRAIAHRGPDAEGFHFDGPAALGHRRLSILDLESGGQPMVRDGVALAFNGEAYDFAELRHQLRAKGHPFTTRSDTEVVLRAYPQRGVSSGEADGELLRLVEAAVEKRLVADVPDGVFLSGGIDSTSIAALAVRHKKPLQTFSIGFVEESFDESP